MAVALAQKVQSPQSNPDTIFVAAVFTGNYGVNGVGDLLNLQPFQAGVNPGGITDPTNLGFIGPNEPLVIAPGVQDENIGGYYIQPTLGTTLLNCALRVFAPNGNELATNAAYPAAITGGSVTLEIVLPQP